MIKLFYFFTFLIILIPVKSFADSILVANSNSDTNLKFIGQVQVTDGDTIRKGKIKIRLHGIDAPENKQQCSDLNNELYACGLLSSAFLKKIINKNDVYCRGVNKDRYGRLIAICYANEINLNSTMVEEGWAIAYRYYSNDYIKEEENAKKNNRGIWEGSFLEPYIWRKNN
tara:strand:- start:284 stop:796 length:513 start_codon:yes stop_codon:yes gene_type:complete